MAETKAPYEDFLGPDEDKNKNIEDLDIGALESDDDISEDKNNKKSAASQETDDTIVISKTKIALIKKLLENVRSNSNQLLEVLSGFITSEDEERISIGQLGDNHFESEDDSGQAAAGRIVEGVFDGESMIGPDGKQYSVPANYASKSKLVEGDILKLTITARGTFVYKQIGPIDRARLIGVLEQEANGSFLVVADGKKLRTLTASVTYFKGKDGDEVVVLVPKAGESKWAAVENIVKSNE